MVNFMKKILKISDDLIIIWQLKRKKEKFTIIHEGEEVVLFDELKRDSGYRKFAYDENYLVVLFKFYDTKNFAHTVAAYNIKEKRLLDLENNENLSDELDYMYAQKESFPLTFVLELINDEELGLKTKEELEDSIIYYLTNGNENITLEEIKQYIFNCYPKLKKYTNLSIPFAVSDYQCILEEFNKYELEFHKMPQIIDEEKDRKAVRIRK